MRVSIITATWNSEKTIASALNSVATQAYSNIEHIIIDGASADKTIDIVKEFDFLCDWSMVSEADGGIYSALNKGLAAATGDIIGFLHSDDFFASPKVIDLVVNAFTDFDCDAVYGDLEYVSKLDPDKVVRKWVSGQLDFSSLRYGWMPPHPTFFMKSSIYLKYGGFDESYRISADYELMLRYLTLSGLVVQYLPQVLVRMRVGGESNRSLVNILRKSLEDFIIMDQMGFNGVLGVLGKNLRKIKQFL